MTNDELEFEKTNKKIELFKTELKALIDKHSFGKKEIDNYNGFEELSSTDYFFVVENKVWYNESIAQILNKIIGDF